MYKIVGLKKSSGDMTDSRTGQTFHYDNVKFYVVDDANVSGIGECPETISVKSSLCPDVYSIDNIGRSVNFSYNKYGKVQSVDVLK